MFKVFHYSDQYIKMYCPIRTKESQRQEQAMFFPEILQDCKLRSSPGQTNSPTPRLWWHSVRRMSIPR